MNSELCNKLGIKFPLFGFTHCRDDVATVSTTGGRGESGTVNLIPKGARAAPEVAFSHPIALIGSKEHAPKQVGIAKTSQPRFCYPKSCAPMNGLKTLTKE